MTQETIKKVDEFLINHHRDITKLKTDKEKLEELWNIALNAGVEVDYEISEFQKKDISNLPVKEIERLKQDHLNVINNFRLVEHNAKVYIGLINFERKEERKLVRKQRIQKILSMFKR